MDQVILYVIIGVFFLLLAYSVWRNNNRSVASDPSDRDFSQRGSERPRYDDPDIRGSGSFGSPRSDDDLDWLSRRRQSRGSMERTASSSNRSSSNDSERVRGQGSFGRDKD